MTGREGQGEIPAFPRGTRPAQGEIPAGQTRRIPPEGLYPATGYPVSSRISSRVSREITSGSKRQLTVLVSRSTSTESIPGWPCSAPLMAATQCSHETSGTPSVTCCKLDICFLSFQVRLTRAGVEPPGDMPQAQRIAD